VTAYETLKLQAALQRAEREYVQTRCRREQDEIEVLHYARDGRPCSAEAWLAAWQPGRSDGRVFRLTPKAKAFLEAHAAAKAPRPASGLPEYRVTRPQGYGPGTAGHQDPAGREGHYVRAPSEQEALQAAQARFPGEPLQIQLWKPGQAAPSAS